MNLTRLSKYEGLKTIEIYNLPHPNWIFVNNSNDIPRTPWVDAPYGWTIRTCPNYCYKFSLPAKHRIEYSGLPEILNDFKNKIVSPIFVVYPSWDFEISGCTQLTNNQLLIEIMKGDIAPLLRGDACPEYIFRCEGPFFNNLETIKGNINILTNYEVKIFLNLPKKININNFVVLEWTRTSEKKLLFHDFFGFKNDQIVNYGNY
jgi:hypothetical protein